MGNLRDIIRELIKDNEEIYSIVCTVDSVDKDKRVCDVSPVDDSAKIFDVRLQSKVSSGIGLVLFPVEGSEVTITFMSKELAFVSCTSEIEEIKLDIGEFSMFIDAENFNKSVKNILINTEEYEKNSTNTKINAQNYEMSGKNATFTLSTIFEVISSADIKMQAISMLIEAATINIKGVTTITGATTINGAATIAGGLSVSPPTGGGGGGGDSNLNGKVTMGGGNNGGIPISQSLVNEMNKIISEVNKIRSAFSGWIPSPKDGGAALKARVGGLNVLNNVNTANISNENAKH